MPGRSLQEIGVGPALRTARTRRGLSVEEAARDTRIRPDLLAALEDEEFDRLLGDVYVRGALRSYAGYLGLNGDKVVALYARDVDEPDPPAPPVSPMGSVGRVLSASRVRDNQRVAVLGAITVIALALAFGIVSRQRTAPEPAALATQAARPELDRRITADVVANRDGADVTVTVDAAAPRTVTLSEGEALSFEATSSLLVRIDPGGSTHLWVNGVDEGSPGLTGAPWQQRFSFDAGSSG
jgi:cytoskeletal protein RodZ